MSAKRVKRGFITFDVLLVIGYNAGQFIQIRKQRRKVMQKINKWIVVGLCISVLYTSFLIYMNLSIHNDYHVLVQGVFGLLIALDALSGFISLYLVYFFHRYNEYLMKEQINYELKYMGQGLLILLFISWIFIVLFL